MGSCSTAFMGDNGAVILIARGTRMKFLILCFTILVVLTAACSPAAPAGGFASLPAGDAPRGAQLFTEQVNGAPACSTCHTLDGSALVGPSLQGYAAVAGTRVENQSPQEYTCVSIVQPAAHIVSGFGNVMYAQYGRQLSPQQLSDLIAYLLTLTS
jgi:mono/diheme cytochrome c family protein